MARPAPASNDGSPARLIAVMVGIVGILLLGSLAWSAVGALLSAMGAAASALSSAGAPHATLGPVVAASSTTAVGTATAVGPTETPAPGVTFAATPALSLPATPIPAEDTPTPAAATPTVSTSARNPWILLPQPQPGSHVAPGQVVVEARGRGDAPIKTIQLDLDGSALPVSLEQRSESTWRGSASVRVGAGQHAVRATVIDSDGRTGSFRWTFAAGP